MATLATIQFVDRRAMPTMKPRKVASTMPIADDQQRVEQADEEGAAVGRAGGGERDQRLADVEAGGVLEEAEAGGDLRAPQVVDRVRGRRRRTGRRRRRRGRSVEDAADLRIVEQDALAAACVATTVCTGSTSLASRCVGPLEPLHRRRQRRRASRGRDRQGRPDVRAPLGCGSADRRCRIAGRPWSTARSGRA